MGDVKTGIAGLDQVLDGGFREGSVNLISGASGTGKTMIAMEFILQGVKRQGERGLFITLEEGRENIINCLPKRRREAIESLAKEFTIMDLSRLRDNGFGADEGPTHGTFDAETIRDICKDWIDKKGVKRVVIDGIVTLYLQHGCENEFRTSLMNLCNSLRGLGVTTLITTEIVDRDRFSRFGVEEYLADSIVLLCYDGGKRTVEVIKVRGQGFAPGRHSMLITDNGINVYPNLQMSEHNISSRRRVKTGIAGLDEMTNGGYIKGDVVLLTGGAGTGKTIFSLQFLENGLQAGEKCIYVSHEESRIQLKRNAKNLGIDLEMYDKKGLLDVVFLQPTQMDMNQYASFLLDRTEGAERLVIDPISDYIQNPSAGDVKAFMAKLVSHLKARQITTLMTAETPDLIGSTKITETGTSFIVDTVLMLRYVELNSEMKKALNILKMRGSNHDKDIREYKISKGGITVLAKFEGVDGLISGFMVRKMTKRVEQFFD